MTFSVCADFRKPLSGKAFHSCTLKSNHLSLNVCDNLHYVKLGLFSLYSQPVSGLALYPEYTTITDLLQGLQAYCQIPLLNSLDSLSLLSLNDGGGVLGFEFGNGNGGRCLYGGLPTFFGAVILFVIKLRILLIISELLIRVN